MDGWMDGWVGGPMYPVIIIIIMTTYPMVVTVWARCPWQPFAGGGMRLRLRPAPAACACGLRLPVCAIFTCWR